MSTDENHLKLILGKWLNKAIAKNDNLIHAEGVYFNILEYTNGDIGIHVYGTHTFDKTDDDWALEEEIVFKHNICILEGSLFSNKDWYHILILLKTYIYDVIKVYPIIKKSAIGFSDSDLYYFTE